MKNNNKYLLGAFGAVMLFIMGIHISLFSNRDHNNFIINKKDSSLSLHSLLSFPHIIIVSVEKEKQRYLL